MSSPVDKIKEKITIEDLISSYIKLEKAGTNYKGRCPFHNEKTPSFFVAPEKGFYYCFGCGVKGDIFTFIQEFEGLDFKGALKILAEKAGVELTYEKSEVKDERDRLYSVMEAATIFFQSLLTPNSEAHTYLKNRGLEDKTISDWRLGFAPDSWRDLLQSLEKRGFTSLEMEKAGLIKKTDNATYDRFRGRVIFPIFDSAGRVVGFSGRILKKDADVAKYLNSPDTPLFNKSEILYGFDKAKNAIKKLNYSILVEGQMDLLMSHQAGIVNTVASSGTALTAKHLMMLKRLSNRVMMAFDPDTAGMKAAMRAWKLGLATGMEVKIAQLPEGYDPADLILKKKEQWLNVLKDSKHIIDFLLSKIKLEIKDKRQMVLAVRDQVLPFIALINSDIEKAHYIKIVSQEIDFREEAIWEDLKKIPKERIEDLESDAGLALHRVSTIDKNILRRDGIEKRVCGLVMWQESKKEPVIEIGKVKERLISVIGEDHWKIYSEANDSNKSDIIFQAEVFFDGHNHLPRETEILLMELEMEVINKESDLIMRKLSQSEKGGEVSTEEDKLKLLDKFNSLSRKKQQLKENQQKL